jgi:hypothetical protein
MNDKEDLMNHLIRKFGYKSYLEIGVENGESIRRIQAQHKDGVDPMKRVAEVNFVMTSDEFFNMHTDKRYDIIFVDGHHDSEYVHRDINNSLSRLNDNGTVVVHDCLPLEPSHAVKMRNITPYTISWTGDGYKVINGIIRNHSDDLECFVVNFDWGVGVIRKKNKNSVNISYDESFSWVDMFSDTTKTLNLISPSEFLERYA